MVKQDKLDSTIGSLLLVLLEWRARALPSRELEVGGQNELLGRSWTCDHLIAAPQGGAWSLWYYISTSLHDVKMDFFIWGKSTKKA